MCLDVLDGCRVYVKKKKKNLSFLWFPFFFFFLPDVIIVLFLLFYLHTLQRRLVVWNGAEQLPVPRAN